MLGIGKPFDLLSTFFRFHLSVYYDHWVSYIGGYGEVLCVQQNRNSEGERMKKWAEAAWRNRRMSLAEALNTSESSSKVLVVDTRICRAL